MFQIPQADEWNILEAGFNKRWNFPNCCGAIDGKHVLIKAPPNAGSEYYNYKGQHSIVLMALVDDKYCFSYINVGFKGSNADGGVFQNCELYEQLENNLLPAGFVIVGDDAFPLKKYLMKPYHKPRHTSLSIPEQVFNYRLSRARRISENAFGILVSRFRVFERCLAVKLSTVNKIVHAACSLHNWLTKTSQRSYLPYGSVDNEDIETGEIIPGQWRHEISDLRNIERYGGRRSTDMAKKMREKFKDYFNNEGAVPWQYKNAF